MSARKKSDIHYVRGRFRDVVLFSISSVVTLVRQNIFVVVPAAYTIILFLYYAYHGVLFQYTLEVFFLVALPLTLYLGRTRKRPHWSLHSSPLLKSENPNQNILFPRGHRFLWSTSCWNNRRVQVHDHRKRETERVSLRA